jgi:uncharacterized protein
MSAPVVSLEDRVRGAWSDARELELDAHGFTVIGPILRADECAALVHGYDDRPRFRKVVEMSRHSFGRGEYRYFADPLPELVERLRARFYELLAPIANRWWEQLDIDTRFPVELAGLRARAHAAGQCLPTPLLLRYQAGDYNCLHQDLYGEVWFPLQVVIGLDQPGRDFEGGELVLVEQRPRMQSRPMVVPLHQGEAAVIPCHHRPRLGSRGWSRVTMRHGVSVLRSGQRHALGIIFHDATT